MSIYSPKRRFILAVRACVALCGLFWVFRLATSPFLEVERKDVTNIGETKVVVQEWRQDAAKWFPENSWVVGAHNHFRDHGRYVFCNEFDLNQVDSQIEASPIAMLWQTDEDSIPIRMVADSAALKSSEKLLSGNTSIGSITAARLSGNVVIRGPNNLWIKGHSFQFDQESMKLWSGSPIDFRWESHKGKATSGIEIQLIANGAQEKLDVTNISNIQLLGIVTVEYSDPPARRGDSGIDLKIRAPNGFRYNVLEKQAKFMGRSGMVASQPITPSDAVIVLRKTPKGGADHLLCPELVIQLAEEIDTETGKTLVGKLKPLMIRAWGRQVKVESPENELILLANDIRYYLDARKLEVETQSKNGRDDLLRIKQKDSLLTLPPTQHGDPAQIQVLHMPDGTIQRAEFTVPPSQRAPNSRPGRITGKAPSGKLNKSKEDKLLALTAEWGESLLVQLAPDGVSRIVKLDGGARVAEDSLNFGLTAQTIAMKILGTEDPSEAADTSSDVVKTVSVSSIVKPDVKKLEADGPEFDFSNLTPDVLTAVGDVMLDSSMGTGRLRDRLTVEFTPVDFETADTAGDGNGKEPSPESGALDRKPAPGDSVSFDADTLKAEVRISPDRKMSFHELWLTGDVEVERKSLKVDEAFKAYGNQLHAANGLRDQAEIQLFGDPARVVSSTGKLEGTRIDLKEVGQQADVKGSGSIRFVSPKGLDGKKLTKPMPIDIYWSDRMEVRDKVANFVGNIRVSMVDENSQTVEVTCTGLTVHLSEKVALGARDDADGFAAFSADGTSGKKNAGIESIEFHDKVLVTINQQTDGIPSGRHTATFADLVVNMKSGDFHAIGPGVIESISPDKEGTLQGAPPVTARANSPAQTTETAFVFMQVEFIGELKGNMNRKEAELTQNVVAMVTPARHVDEEVDLQIVSTDDLPERAGILRAEILNISSIEQPGLGPKDDTISFSMIARNNARLESRDITARADEIVYDHAKQQFIMKAEGEGRVSVNHRSGRRGKFNSFNGKRCEYYRRTHELKGDRIGGFEFSK